MVDLHLDPHSVYARWGLAVALSSTFHPASDKRTIHTDKVRSGGGEEEGGTAPTRGGSRQKRRRVAKLRAYRRNLLAGVADLMPQLQAMASYSGTWNIELPAGEEGPVAFESPAFSLGADFRFRLIATVTPGKDDDGCRMRRVGLYLRYLGQTGGVEGLLQGSGQHEKEEVTTDLAVPTIQCSVHRTDRPGSPWLSSQPVRFDDPSAFECGVDEFATLARASNRPVGLRLAFLVSLLSVHFPSQPEAEEMRSRAWEAVQAAVEQALAAAPEQQEPQ